MRLTRRICPTAFLLLSIIANTSSIVSAQEKGPTYLRPSDTASHCRRGGSGRNDYQIALNLLTAQHPDEALAFLNQSLSSCCVQSKSQLLYVRAQVYEYGFGRSADALADINSSVAETEKPPLPLQPKLKAEQYKLKAELEEKLRMYQAAIEDYSIAENLARNPNPTEIFNPENRIYFFNHTANCRHQLGDKSGERADRLQAAAVRYATSSGDEFPAFSYFHSTIQADRVKDLLLSDDPLYALNLPPKASGVDNRRPEMGQFYSVKLEIRPPVNEAKFSFPARMTQLPQFPKLYRYSWGYLELVHEPATNLVTHLILRSPDAQKTAVQVRCEPFNDSTQEMELAAARKIVSDFPSALNAGILVYEHLRQQKKFDEAYEASKKLRLLCDESSFKQKNYAEALELIREQIKHNPDEGYDTQRRAMEASCLVELGKCDEAAAIIDKMSFDMAGVGYDPILPSKLMARARFKAATRDIAGAKADLDKAIQASFDQAYIWTRDEALAMLTELEKSAEAGNSTDSSCDDSGTLVVLRKRPAL